MDSYQLHHVVDAHVFKAEFLFYRFYEDEEGKSVVSLADDTKKAGWVEKLTTVGLGTWRSQKYALISQKHTSLYLYESDISVSPLKVVPLKDCVMSSTDGPLGIKLKLGASCEGKKSFKFSLPTPEEKEEWMNALAAVGAIFDSNEQKAAKAAASFFVLHDKDMNSQPVVMDKYKGCVCLVTNVASK
jgi:hypothetical protein